MSFDRNPPPSIAAQSTDARSTAKATRIERAIRKLPEGYVVPLAGGIAGAVAGIVSCPLDVIKTKLQAQGGFQSVTGGRRKSSYHGVTGTAATIWREDGMRGMYRGLGPMLLGYIPTWAVYLTVYNKTQAYFRTKTGESAALLECKGALTLTLLTR